VSIEAFDLTSNTPEERALIESAVAKCDFDFTRLLPRLKEEKGRTAIPVTWEDLSRYNQASSQVVVAGEEANHIKAFDEQARHHDDHDHGEGEHRRATLGLAYYSGKIAIEKTLVSRPALAEIVFLAEAAHMVDFFLITPEHRGKLYDLFHEPGYENHDHGWFEETGNNDYWSWVGEAWMYGFIKAFTDIEPGAGGMHHELTEQDVEEVRKLFGMEPPPLPEPVPDPDADPFFASYGSKAFHDGHKNIRRDLTFATYEEAAATGLRPCRTCKPWVTAATRDAREELPSAGKPLEDPSPASPQEGLAVEPR
jgi:hypothetical protein